MISKLEEALEFARNSHGDQRYGDFDLPYYFHLCEVLSVVSTLSHSIKVTENTKVVAVLHDIVEDTPVTVPEIAAKFGEEVADAVKLLTDPPGENRKARKEALYKQFENAPDNWSKKTAAFVKLTDRFCNHRETIRGKNTRLQKMYSEEWSEFRKIFGIYNDHRNFLLWIDDQVGTLKREKNHYFQEDFI